MYNLGHGLVALRVTRNIRLGSLMPNAFYGWRSITAAVLNLLAAKPYQEWGGVMG